MPRLPSSQNVPQVSPQITRDPGVKAPKGAFDSSLAVATGELSPTIDKYAQVIQRQESRRDTIDRSSLINQYNQEVDKELLRLNTESDLSRGDVIEEFGSFMTKRRQELIESHKGSADSRAVLETRLQDVGAAFTGRAAGISAQLGREKVKKTFNNALTPLVTMAAQEPKKKNIDALFLDLETQIEDLRGAFDPAEETALRQSGREIIALTSVDSLLSRGRIEEAAVLLEDGGLIQALSPDKQRETRRRIDTALFEMGEEQRKLARDERTVTESFGAVDLKSGKFFTAVRTKAGIAKQIVDNDGRIKLMPMNSEDVRPVSTQLSEIGKTEQKELRDQEVSARSLIATVGDTLKLLENNPDINTFTARGASIVNDLQQEVKAFAGVMGMKFDESQLDPSAHAESFDKMGIENARMRSLITSLAFQAAAASGQAGRDVSDKDIRRFVVEIGGSSSDPRALAKVLADVSSRTVRRFKMNVKARTGKDASDDLGLSDLAMPQPNEESSDLNLSTEDEALIQKYLGGGK